MSLPVDFTGSKNPVQAIGSSTSYGKRYVAAALLNLTSRGEEDDATGLKPKPERISADQVMELRRLLEETGNSEVTLLPYLDLPSLDALPADRFGRTVEAIKLRRKTS